MKSSNQIRFDFEQAKRRAAELDDIAEDMGRLSNTDLENTMAELAGGWKGDSAAQFQKKVESLQTEINSTAKELSSIATTIRNIARTIYNAEMEALTIANRRQYGGGGSGGGGGGGGHGNSSGGHGGGGFRG